MKIYQISLFILLFIVSCELSENPSKDGLVLEEVIADASFVGYMAANRELIARYSSLDGESPSEKQAHLARLNLAVAQNDGKRISEEMGFDSEQSLITQFSLAKGHLNSLRIKYPKLFEGNSLKNAVHAYQDKKPLDEFLISFSQNTANGRVLGCAGGAACFRTASDCKAAAESDLAIGSAGCTSLGWFPAYWPVCQGSVFLNYAGDQLACAYELDKCCEL